MAKKKQSFFTLNELKNDIFTVTKDERYVFMPNEIFKDLLERFKDEEKAKSSTHIAFAYAYTYLAHYMYRYCKYYGSDGNTAIDEAMIKQVLGFPAKADQYTYITKKSGILDELGYIRKESDKPFQCTQYKTDYVNENGVEIMCVDFFDMESSLKFVHGNTKNRKINYPVKAFVRGDKWVNENDEDEKRTGTFFRIDNTHLIDFDIFMYCMSQSELGVKGFYLYSFLLYMNNKHLNGFDCSIDRFVSLTGLGIRTIRDQLERLEKRNMITNDHKPYCLDKKTWQKTKSNTYGALPYKEFISRASELKEIPKQRRISAKRYAKEIGFVSYENDLVVGTDENKSNSSEPDKQGFSKIHHQGESPFIYNSDGESIPLPF